MGKRNILRTKTDYSDYPHKHHQLFCPWNRKPKNTEHHGDFHYGHKGADVTLMHHLPPPPHSYHPSMKNAPDPYFGREGCDVTEYMRYISGQNPPDKDYWHGREATDISEHLRAYIPPVSNPAGDMFWGRPKSYVTDPSVSPNLTPPARPMDGGGSKDAMMWPAKSREDQVPLGQSVSKLQSIASALARSSKTQSSKEPPRSPPPPKKRPSPGEPIGKTGKNYPPHTLKIKVPPSDTYWGRTKSYITDYAVSPNLTPPGRPLDGEGAREAMTYVPITPQADDKIPIGKSISRMRRPSAKSAEARPQTAVPARPQTVAGSPPKPQAVAGSPPCAISSPPSVPSSAGKSSAAVSKNGAMSTDRSSGAGSPALSDRSCAKSCKWSERPKREDTIRWRDQINSARTSELRRANTPCCNKKTPRGPYRISRSVALANIRCPRTSGPEGSRRPPPASSAKEKRTKLPTTLHEGLVAGQDLDPHRDAPWHGRTKSFITDPNVSPNLTPPGRNSTRSPQEKAKSVAKYLASRPPQLPPKPKTLSKPATPASSRCDAGLHLGSS